MWQAVLVSVVARVRRVLKERGVTQEWLETEASLTKGHVSRILSGKREPALHTVEAMARALGVSPGWLAYGDETPTDPHYLREEVIRLMGATKHPLAVADLRKHEPPTPDVSAEYWVRTLDALDAMHRAEKADERKAAKKK